MIFIDNYISICYICISYLFMIYKDKRVHEQRGGAPGYSSGCVVFFYFVQGLEV